jgi:hypothetical protein
VSHHHFLLARRVARATVVLDMKTNRKFGHRRAATRRAAAGVLTVVTVRVAQRVTGPTLPVLPWAGPPRLLLTHPA